MKFFYYILLLFLLLPVTRAQGFFTEYGAGYASSRITSPDGGKHRGGISFSSGFGYAFLPSLQGMLMVDYGYFPGNNSHLLRALVDAFYVSEGYTGDFYDRFTASLRLRFAGGSSGIVPFFSAGGGVRVEKQRVTLRHGGRYPYSYTTDLYDFGSFFNLGGGVKLCTANGYAVGAEALFLINARYASDNYSASLFFSAPL